VVAELARMPVQLAPLTLLDSAPVAAARLLTGDLVLPGSDYRLSARFSAEALLSAPPHLELAVAGMAVPAILLRAYAGTKDSRFLDAAATYVRDWAKFESKRVLPEALFWNDHAIAGRAIVLTELWLYYRSPANPHYDPATAQDFITLVRHYGALLGRDSLYTYRSNHGSMQNLALLVLALAFPHLDEASEWAETGTRRFLEQMDYYLGQDGIITEHSPGYQGFGIGIVGASLRCLTLLNKPVPRSLAEHYERAKEYFLQLVRPDGTLPTFGDTGSREPRALVSMRGPDGRYEPLRPIGSTVPKPLSLSADGASAIWWDGLSDWPNGPDLAQTAITWANFPSRVHKHADEMSVDVWSSGRQWIGNVGYWPYHLWGRDHAESWEGSNAPHLAGERRNSSRTTVPLLHVHDPRLGFLDVQRRTGDGTSIRRQIVRLPPDVWVIIDSFDDSQSREIRTIWSFGEELAANRPRPDLLRLEHSGRKLRMNVVTGGSPGHRVSDLIASREPFAGWRVATDRSIAAVPSILVQQSSDRRWSWLALVLDRTDAPAAGAVGASMEDWKGANEWRFRIDSKAGQTTIARSGRSLVVAGAAGAFTIDAADVAKAEFLPAMEQAYRRVATAGPSRWHDDLIPYRLRVTYALAALCLGHLGLVVVAARYRPRIAETLGAAAVLGWIVCGLWLNLVYFA
jgi:hypothetical protein